MGGIFKRNISLSQPEMSQGRQHTVSLHPVRVGVCAHSQRTRWRVRSMPHAKARDLA